MTVGWCGAVISILLLLHSPETAEASQKIIKLIVPHKIKYLHHTHVLLVKPKKKSHQVKEELIDEDANYHHYIHDTRPKGKSHVHYVLPYIAQSKESQKNYKKYKQPSHNDEDSYHMDDYHSRPEESDVVVKVLPPGKGAMVHRGIRVPYEAESAMKFKNKPRYVYRDSMRKPQYSYESPSGTEDMLMPSLDYHTLPEHYNSEYMTPEVDPNGLTPEEGGWGAPTFSIPEKTAPIRNYYKGGYFDPSRSARYSR